jgi:23S rRNA (guanosine2251-2'-O)-methyltransferase
MREILYGRQPVRETLRAGRRQVYRLLLVRGLKRSGVVGQILTLAKQAGIPVDEMDRREFDRWGGEVNHQGLAAEVSGYPYLDLPALRNRTGQAGAPFFLVVDHLRDPQNLGSLLRSAEAAGAHGVVLPDRRAASVTPAAVRASAGAAEHVRVSQVTNLVRAMESLKEAGIWLAGLDARPEATLCYDADLTGAIGLVVGSEGKGLARLVRENCDFLIRLPMEGQVESLNAAVAGALALYEVRRQRALAAGHG